VNVSINILGFFKLKERKTQSTNQSKQHPVHTHQIRFLDPIQFQFQKVPILKRKIKATFVQPDGKSLFLTNEILFIFFFDRSKFLNQSINPRTLQSES